MSDVRVPHAIQREVDKMVYGRIKHEPPAALWDLEGNEDMLQLAWDRTLRKIRRALPSVED